MLSFSSGSWTCSSLTVEQQFHGADDAGEEPPIYKATVYTLHVRLLDLLFTNSRAAVPRSG